jgi:hypothetical protein
MFAPGLRYQPMVQRISHFPVEIIFSRRNIYFDSHNGTAVFGCVSKNECSLVVPSKNSVLIEPIDLTGPTL